MPIKSGRILTLPRQTAEIKKEVGGQRSGKSAPPLPGPPPIYSNGGEGVTWVRIREVLMAGTAQGARRRGRILTMTDDEPIREFQLKM